MRYVVLAEVDPSSVRLVGVLEADTESAALQQAGMTDLASDIYYAVAVDSMVKARVTRTAVVELELIEPALPDATPVIP